MAGKEKNSAILNKFTISSFRFFSLFYEITPISQSTEKNYKQLTKINFVDFRRKT
jgi:hypothetical protein